MEISSKILSDITVHMKYAKYVPELNRRETWEELVTRNKEMHQKKYPQIKDEIEKVYKLVYDKKVLPSMRSLQFGGKPIEISPNRIYNCAYMPIDHTDSFAEAMFLLLGGTGVGYSVQRHHVDKLPEIKKPNTNRTRRYLIGDSIEGWADAIKVLIESYFGSKSSTPIFDYSDVRPKGARLVTSGGKAPGPQPLKDCIHNIKKILDTKNDGDKLKPIEVHDIVCFIADAVLAGGIRRAALISLFSADDDEMLACKSGNWWELNPQRGRANNSAVLMRHKITKEYFMDIWKRIELSGSGEPGIYLSNDKDWGTNPSLRAGTKVLTTEGIFPIEDLQDKKFYVKNLNGEISEAKCWLSGVDKQLWKLTLSDGHEYFATPEHEWPVWDGTKYIKVKTPDLVSGDKLPILRESKLFDGDLGNYEDGFLSGWLIGDGWVTNRKEYSE
jgi:ribonucleoside-triphosphate reductase